MTTHHNQPDLEAHLVTCFLNRWNAFVQTQRIVLPFAPGALEHLLMLHMLETECCTLYMWICWGRAQGPGKIPNKIL